MCSSKTVPSDIYSMIVHGRVLGEIKGSELASIADEARKLGDKHSANAEFLTHLDKLVKCYEKGNIADRDFKKFTKATEQIEPDAEFLKSAGVLEFMEACKQRRRSDANER